jgi:hypothetical protein
MQGVNVSKVQPTAQPGPCILQEQHLLHSVFGTDSTIKPETIQNLEYAEHWLVP